MHRKVPALEKALCAPFRSYSTVTLFARFLGLSTFRPLATEYPDESYPLYSGFSRPSGRIEAACIGPL